MNIQQNYSLNQFSITFFSFLLFIQWKSANKLHFVTVEYEMISNDFNDCDDDDKTYEVGPRFDA